MFCRVGKNCCLEWFYVTCLKNNGFPAEFCFAKNGNFGSFWSQICGVYQYICGSSLCMYCTWSSPRRESMDEWVDHSPSCCEYFSFQSPVFWTNVYHCTCCHSVITSIWILLHFNQVYTYLYSSCFWSSTSVSRAL